MSSSRACSLNLVAFAALTLGVAGAQSHAHAQDQATFPIINGEDYESDDFPSAGQLIVAGQIGGVEQVYAHCSAVLIAPDTVLTAAHCVGDGGVNLYGYFNFELQRYHISFQEDLTWMAEQVGDGGTGLPDDAVGSTRFKWHWRFDPRWQGFADEQLGNAWDVGLVFLDEEITDVPFSYLPLPEEADQLQVGLEVTAVGYGLRDPAGTLPANVRTGVESTVNRVGDWEFQIGDRGSDGRTCYGDSGGPAFAELDTDATDPWRVVGITSRVWSLETTCLEGGVDLRPEAYREWIEEEMLDACDDGVRSYCDEPGLPDPLGRTACERQESCAAGGAGRTSAWAIALALVGVATRRRGRPGARRGGLP